MTTRQRTGRHTAHLKVMILYLALSGANEENPFDVKG